MSTWQAPPITDERVLLMQEAMDHQFDKDPNADLIVESDDPSVQAAVRLVNKYGGYAEIVVTAPTLIEAMDVALGLRAD